MKNFQILSYNENNNTILVEYPVYMTHALSVPKDNSGNDLTGLALIDAITLAINNLSPNAQPQDPDSSAETFMVTHDLILEPTPPTPAPITPQP